MSFCACLSHQLLQILDHTGCTCPVDEDEVGMVEQELQSLVVPSVRVDPALSVMAQPSVSLSSADTPTPILFPATTRLSPLSTIHTCQTMGSAFVCVSALLCSRLCCHSRGKPPILCLTPLDFRPPWDSHAARRKGNNIDGCSISSALRFRGVPI